MGQEHSLQDVPIFGKLSPAELRLVKSVAKTKRYKMSQVVFLEGEPLVGFYVVLSGRVSIYRVSRSGTEELLRHVNPYESFGESAFSKGSGFYVTCAQTLEDSTLLFIPAQEFTALMRDNPAFAVRISHALGVRLMQFNHASGIFASTVEGRIAKYLLNEIQLNKSVRLPEPYFNLTLPKKELADHLGMASETLSRVFKRLKEDKIIRQVSKKIFVTNPQRLRELTRAKQF